jgi:cytochrome c oxidase assembly protein subunit 15
MKAFRVLAIAAAIAVYGQVVLGAVVRITGSGLGCPDWPACQGRIIPNFADAQVAIEFAHRLFGTTAGLLMVLTAVAALVLYRRSRETASPVPRGLAVAAVSGVLLIVVQGLLGGITVLTGNTPFTVAIHLGNALLVLGAAALVALWSLRLPTGAPAETAPTGLLPRLAAAAVAAYAIIITGAYVVGAGAGGACWGWPLCGAARTPFTDIHMLHRTVVLVGTAVILWAMFSAARQWRGRPAAMVAYLTGGLLLAEAAVGSTQAVLGLPAVLRVTHVALASAVWTGVVLAGTVAWLESRREPVRAGRRSSLAGAGS